jgi:hypothetical protein
LARCCCATATSAARSNACSRSATGCPRVRTYRGRPPAKTDTLEEKQHKEIVAALYKIASEIIGLKSELTTVRHVLSEIGKKVGN